MVLLKKIWIIAIFLCFNTTAQIITTIAGGGTGSDGVLATSASLIDPHGGVFDRSGNLYIVEGQGHRVRKVDAIAKTISTVAGTGNQGYNGDNFAATLVNITPNAITIDSFGNLYITDSTFIRKINKNTGVITIIGGGGTIPAGDGHLATDAILNVTWGICFDTKGNLYFSEPLGFRLRKISTSGILSTIAGNGLAGYSGDNGLATSARCNQIFGVCTDKYDNIYFVDGPVNYRIRKIDSNGIITTIAGNGSPIFNGDAIDATNAQINPLDVKVDFLGNIYLADMENERIRRVNLEGVIYTFTGTGISGYNGEGIAADSAKIYYPSGITLDSCGNVFFGETGNSRFRKVSFPHCKYLNVNAPEFEHPTITLYPNPASVTLTIQTNLHIEQIGIINYLGQRVFTHAMHGEERTEIDIGYLPNGLYWAEAMSSEGEKIVKKFIKQ